MTMLTAEQIILLVGNEWAVAEWIRRMKTVGFDGYLVNEFLHVLHVTWLQYMCWLFEVCACFHDLTCENG